MSFPSGTMNHHVMKVLHSDEFKDLLDVDSICEKLDSSDGVRLQGFSICTKGSRVLIHIEWYEDYGIVYCKYCSMTFFTADNLGKGISHCIKKIRLSQITVCGQESKLRLDYSKVGDKTVVKFDPKETKKEKVEKPLSQQAVQDYERNFNVVSWIQKADAKTIYQVNENLKYAYCIGMMNVNGGLNIGMMVRQAVIYGCQDIFVFGRKKFDRRATVGADNYITITHVSGENETKDPEKEGKPIKNNDPIDAQVFLRTMQQHKLIPIFVEQGGILLHQVSWGVMAAKTKNWDKTKDRYCFIFGNEGHGISSEILALSRKIPGSFILSLPQHSLLRSLNVAMACSIVLHEFYSHVIFEHTIGKYMDP